MKKIIIIGAGPAGLTAAYELLKDNGEYAVTILEETKDIGGISKTVNVNGNRMDMGGHRFFSKVDTVNDWWENMMPTQGEKSIDDIELGRGATVKPGGANPNKEDRVMLKRHRVSRILFDSKFYDYPISMKLETFTNMGFFRTVKCGFSYLGAMLHKRPENNLENFYINRFGKQLYNMFFEYYTENLWGRHPRDIDASWGKQRVKGISIKAVLKNMIKKDKKKVETSLIEEFSYPKLGPGQMWEITAREIERLGGVITMNACVTHIHRNSNGEVDKLTYKDKDGVPRTISGDIFISSMPLKDLVVGMDSVPDNVLSIAKDLPYRDYMTVGVLVKKLNLRNNTKIKTFGNIVPDCWIYVQDRKVKLGRLQIYNNWSPYMVENPKENIWIGLEYFVQENDNYWNMKDNDFIDFACDEMIKLGLIDSKEAVDVNQCHVERVKKAYPAYFDSYKDIDKVIEFVNTIPNIYCVGRNGQHRYNNIDHSMCTSFETVKNIKNGISDKANIWAVNTENEYHESKEKEA